MALDPITWWNTYQDQEAGRDRISLQYMLEAARERLRVAWFEVCNVVEDAPNKEWGNIYRDEIKAFAHVVECIAARLVELEGKA